MNKRFLGSPAQPMEIPREYRQRTYYRYLLFYFGFMHALAFVQMLFNRNFRVFWLVDSVALYSIVLAAAYIIGTLRRQAGKLGTPDVLVLAFIVWSLVSGLLYLQADNPALPVSYLYGIHYLVFPVFLFFSVKRLDWPLQARLLRNICYLHLFLFVVGLVMYYWQPDFYTAFLRSILPSRDRAYEDWQLYARMHSYLGSTTIGLLSGITAIFLNIFKFPVWKKIAMISVCLFAGILTQQRGGFVSVAVGVLYFILAGRRKVLKKLVVTAATALLLILGLNYFRDRTAAIGDTRIDLINYTKDRLLKRTVPAGVLSERTIGYINGWNNFVRFPLGLGVGATTSAADAAQANLGGQVVDANYMRILSDLGFPGLSLFLLILGTVFLSLKKNPNRFAFAAVLAIYAVLALGTNIFDHYYMSHFFWLLLGVMSSKRHVRSFVKPCPTPG